MAAQDVADIVPRVRRALEGAKALPDADPAKLSDDEVEAAAADAIGDLILYTGGGWLHAITVSVPGAPGDPYHFTVDPGLSFEEQGLVAIQAALNYFFHVFREQKVSQRIKAEGREWEYSQSANLLRDAIKLLKDQRDLALRSLQGSIPPLARAASFLATRDPVAAALIEPYAAGGAGAGGQALLPPGYQG